MFKVSRSLNLSHPTVKVSWFIASLVAISGILVVAMPNQATANMVGSVIRLRNRNWNKCLNLQNASVDGVQPNVWNCVPHGDQEWQILNSSSYLPNLKSLNDTQWEDAINSASDINAISNNPNSDLGKLYRDLSNDLFGKFYRISGCFICDDDYNATGGGYGWHGAIDIASPIGTSVKSVVNGTVEVANLNNSGWLSIKGNDGKYYIYGHLDTFSPGIQVGSKVTKGMILGTTGARGNNGNRYAFAAHLHFEVSRLPWGALTSPKPTTKQGFRDRSHNPPKSYWQLRQ